MAHQVDLSWTASIDTVDGYNVLKSGTTGGPYTKVNASVITGTTFSDVGPFASNGPFFYVAESVLGTAVSAFSNEISVFLPPAPPTSLVLVSAT